MAQPIQPGNRSSTHAPASASTPSPLSLCGDVAASRALSRMQLCIRNRTRGFDAARIPAVTISMMASAFAASSTPQTFPELPSREANSLWPRNVNVNLGGHGYHPSLSTG